MSPQQALLAATATAPAPPALPAPTPRLSQRGAARLCSRRLGRPPVCRRQLRTVSPSLTRTRRQLRRLQLRRMMRLPCLPRRLRRSRHRPVLCSSLLPRPLTSCSRPLRSHRVSSGDAVGRRTCHVLLSLQQRTRLLHRGLSAVQQLQQRLERSARRVLRSTKRLHTATAAAEVSATRDTTPQPPSLTRSAPSPRVWTDWQLSVECSCGARLRSLRSRPLALMRTRWTSSPVLA